MESDAAFGIVGTVIFTLSRREIDDCWRANICHIYHHELTVALSFCWLCHVLSDMCRNSYKNSNMYIIVDRSISTSNHSDLNTRP